MKYTLVTIAMVALALAPIGCRNKTDQTSLESGKSTSAQPGTTNVSQTGSPVTTTVGTATTTSTMGGMPATALDKADQEFLTKAAEGGLAEVALGKTAVQNAASPDVKNFGQKMVDDHGKANDQLKDLASKKNFVLPTGPGKANEDQLSKLAALKGADFDKAYMKLMVEDHEKDVIEFMNASRDAKDPDIKAWAADTVATLKGHLKMAKETHDKVSGGKGSGKGTVQF